MPAPTTKWTRDNGTTISQSTGVLVDELDNLFVDELGDSLLDSTSTGGESLSASWAAPTLANTQWADAISSNLPLGKATRVTAQGDVRVTAQGDTRVTSASLPNKYTPASWTEDEYA